MASTSPRFLLIDLLDSFFFSSQSSTSRSMRVKGLEDCIAFYFLVFFFSFLGSFLKDVDETVDRSIL